MYHTEILTSEISELSFLGLNCYFVHITTVLNIITMDAVTFTFKTCELLVDFSL